MKNTRALPLHEWLVVLSFSLVIFAICGLGWYRSRSFLPNDVEIAMSNGFGVEVEVEVTGQVSFPGIHRFPKGVKIKEVLQRVQPLPNGDLSSIKERQKLRDGTKLHIPEKKWIEIEWRGAVVSPGVYSILSGTRVCEAIEQVDVCSDADLGKLKKNRRFLVSNEKIVVPRKRNNKRKKQTSLDYFH